MQADTKRLDEIIQELKEMTDHYNISEMFRLMELENLRDYISDIENG